MILWLKPFLPFLLLLIKPLSSKPLTFIPRWVPELLLVALLLCQESILHAFDWIQNWSISITQIPYSVPAMPFSNWLFGEDGAADSASKMSILDLPELPLELILGKFSPAELCRMACVSRGLRDRCRSDHLWVRHMSDKWGKVLGEAAIREWELRVASRICFSVDGDGEGVELKGWRMKLSSVWPLSWLKNRMEGGRKPKSPLPADSLISFYQALESGRFSFPAQIFNRENGHTGFLLSCYDAEISYNSSTNKFYARYPPHGKRSSIIEEVPWDRVRATSVTTSAHEFHISDCLSDLRPGDHIEIQWRKNKGFPYGWWYGVVGHSETCDKSERHCCCHRHETIAVEFNHYVPGSRWRTATINWKEHREEGNENDGFYGGIRKLQNKEEISRWIQLWPSRVLE
ncbi:F-box protein [Apostasia shenzhenica]|uniref:F-box protein n=1 Tax=Apostasia shenzhenica TaxID=1088818 RepID=A0A2I0A6P1_9ASPA|nr:F-box protein [Apostasia shenzhenica]